MKRIDKNNYYLDIAKAVCKRSTCIKRRYGCVIVNNDTIIAAGYNGSARGEENCCDKGTCNRQDSERYKDYDKCPAIHAEQNALMVASREQLIGATMYLYCEEYSIDKELSARHEEEIKDWCEDENPMPCNLCIKQIKNSGIVKIVNRRGIVWEN